ncbi:hypothetical protein [Acinetobacter sp.]|uniref:hypothetical protein n=1 Tax=Acinetobacter sp. TaxID=472 RepID=UPI00388EF817
MSFDLFEGLSKLSGRDLQWYSKLSAEDQKAASPFVIARWMTGTSDQAQLVRINTFVNPYVFSLGQEKSLLFSLLAAAATGKTKRYKWMKAPGAKAAVKLRLEVIKQYYEVSTREAGGYAATIDGEDILEMAENLGWEKEDLAKLKKEVGDGSGNTQKPVGVKKKPR